ncbi:hypothetical protein PACTADRAFT_47614 [Pachysolen tannophilus NRRL Y-2460]|uniref:Methyltransferase type 11 domain-containing protein n=1 Tax=Pachysolen tannophilus NRRL Y-2460 TaxID=669874 RepID=A0A1E4U171_PACTA|nr:hypothetical protein PACTADRAFT_47614 [Pachysolen tannophilus NRRL Y-2460]
MSIDHRSVNPNSLNSFNSNHVLYDQVRPDYDKDFVNSFLHKLNAYNFDTNQYRNDLKIVEIASGTGKFTTNLINCGWNNKSNLVTVEPSIGMIESFKKRFPNLNPECILNGSSYEIPLEDNSADIIIVAQGYHWFADTNSLKEMYRILKPKGKLGFIWNFDASSNAHVFFQDENLENYSLDYQNDELKKLSQEFIYNSGNFIKSDVKKLEKLINYLCINTSKWDLIANYIYSYDINVPQYRHGKWRKTFKNQDFFSRNTVFEGFTFKNLNIAKDKVYPYWESRSYITSLSDKEKLKVKNEIDNIIDGFDDKDFVDESKKIIRMFLGSHFFVIDVNK